MTCVHYLYPRSPLLASHEHIYLFWTLLCYFYFFHKMVPLHHLFRCAISLFLFSTIYWNYSSILSSSPVQYNEVKYLWYQGPLFTGGLRSPKNNKLQLNYGENTNEYYKCLGVFYGPNCILDAGWEIAVHNLRAVFHVSVRQVETARRSHNVPLIYEKTSFNYNIFSLIVNLISLFFYSNL